MLTKVDIIYGRAILFAFFAEIKLCSEYHEISLILEDGGSIGKSHLSMRECFLSTMSHIIDIHRDEIGLSLESKTPCIAHNCSSYRSRESDESMPEILIMILLERLRNLPDRV